MSKKKIVIDPGHGGNDRANRGQMGYVEADGVLKISLLLKAELLTTGEFDVRLTRETDKTLGLTARGKMAAGTDLFISQHTNACDKKQRGTEVFYSIDLPNNKVLAQKLSKSVSSALGIIDRGAKIRESVKYPGEDYYTVIDAAQDCGVPNVLLIESAFHDNKMDEALLLQDKYLKIIAQAQAKVICEWFDIYYSPTFNSFTAEEISKLPVIKINSVGDIVKLAQTRLNAAGYDCGNVDGDFGIKTKYAVIAFQRAHKLNPDGVIGNKTWTALQALQPQRG